jgi:hypothetical protein
MVQIYTGSSFIQGSGLYMVQVYTGFRFIQGSAAFSLRYGITYYKFGIAGW